MENKEAGVAILITDKLYFKCIVIFFLD